MARGTNLARIIMMYKAEVGASQSTAAGLNADSFIRELLSRVQEDLWLNYDWEFLRVTRDILTQAGQQFYAPPADLDFERVQHVHVQWSGIWRPVIYGVDETQYNLQNPALNVRNDPVLRWQYADPGMIELWPLPATNNAAVRFRGIRRIGALQADSDVAELDDRLVVLFAAAETLQDQKRPTAPAKLAASRQRLEQLRGRSIKRRHTMLDGRGAHTGATNDMWRIRVTYARAG
jgi:hypothetical protein